MTIADALWAEFEHESKTTRRFLERLPADRLAWRPHEKSLSAGQLALHIAQVPTGVAEMSLHEQCPLPDFSAAFATPDSTAQVLAAHDAGLPRVREVLRSTSDDRMHQIWSATAEGRVVASWPRATLFRMLMLNHWIQHRGQFGVYLRLLGAAVPSSYGPSGDEPMGGA